MAPEKPEKRTALRTVPVRSADTLLSGTLKRGDRALLNLDLQGTETEAPNARQTALMDIEVILIEGSLFPQAYGPSSDVIDFFASRKFGLHAVASLSVPRRANRAHQADCLSVAECSELRQDTA
ncbi:hypothetical protein [Silicimonas algicola]|uniref:hypothetical protein n=1 Tax=Silicimonas algicola TaxID=1826607 RepID=UPI0011B1F4AB|nr:hypothetical protein [Silicimonas algicola]